LEAFLQNSDKAGWKRRGKKYSQVDVFNRLRRFNGFKDDNIRCGVDYSSSTSSHTMPNISRISRADLRKIDFKGLVFHDARFEDINFDGADFKGGSFDYVTVERCSFKGADMRDMSRFRLSALFADFEGADLRGTRFDIRDYDALRLLLLSEDRFVHFSKTKITQGQKDYLVRFFHIPEDRFLGRFEITPS